MWYEPILFKIRMSHTHIPHLAFNSIYSSASTTKSPSNHDNQTIIVLNVVESLSNHLYILVTIRCCLLPARVFSACQFIWVILTHTYTSLRRSFFLLRPHSFLRRVDAATNGLYGFDKKLTINKCHDNNLSPVPLIWLKFGQFTRFSKRHYITMQIESVVEPRAGSVLPLWDPILGCVQTLVWRCDAFRQLTPTLIRTQK